MMEQCLKRLLYVAFFKIIMIGLVEDDTCPNDILDAKVNLQVFTVRT